MSLVVSGTPSPQNRSPLSQPDDAQALKRFAPPKRHALVAAFLVETRKALLDQVVTMHDQYMTGLDRRSRLAFEDKRRRLRRRARAGIDTLLAIVDTLLDAGEVARKLDTGGPEKLLDDAPRHFIPAAWRKALGPAGSRPRRALWELALAFAVRDALRSGDLYLPASRRHMSFSGEPLGSTWNLVMGERQWAEAKEDAYARLLIPLRRRACGPADPLRRGGKCGGAGPAQQPVRPHPEWRTPAATGRRAADHASRTQAPERRRRQPAAGARRTKRFTGHRGHAAPSGSCARRP